MFIPGLIRDVVNVFFVVIIFAMIGRGVDVVEWTVFRIMLGFRSFTIFAVVVRTEGFEMASLLTLVADASSHVRGKNLVDKEGWNFTGIQGGCSPRGMNKRWTVGYSRWDIAAKGCASEIGQSMGRVFHNTVMGR
jgi:hypothetical protein